MDTQNYKSAEKRNCLLAGGALLLAVTIVAPVMISCRHKSNINQTGSPQTTPSPDPATAANNGANPQSNTVESRNSPVPSPTGPFIPSDPDIQRIPSPALSEEASQEKLAEIGNDLDAMVKSIRSLRVKLQIRSYDPVIKSTDTTVAEFAFKVELEGLKDISQVKPMVLTHYTYPAETIVSIIGTQVIVYQKKINQVIMLTKQTAMKKYPWLEFIEAMTGKSGQRSAGKKPAKQKEMPTDLAAKYLGDYLVGQQRVALVSFKAKGRRSFDALSWIDYQTHFPVRVQLNLNGGTQTIDILKHELNPKIPNREFVINYPRDAQIIHQ